MADAGLDGRTDCVEAFLERAARPRAPAPKKIGLQIGREGVMAEDLR